MTPAIQAAIDSALADTQTEWGSSRWACFRRCPREHQIRYHLNVVPRYRARHFGVGSLVHAGLRYVQEGVMAREPAPRAWADLVQAAAALPDTSPEVCDEAGRLLHWYFERWGLDNAGWPEDAEIVACEVEWRDDSFALPYTARADTVLEVGGDIVLVDTKTRARGLPGDSKAGPDKDARAEYARKLATRPQFLGLSWLAQRHYKLESPPPLWVNAICKLKLPTFGRLLVPFTQEKVNRWAREQARASAIENVGDVHAMCDPSAHAPMNYDACAPELGYGCQYFDWCHGSEEQREIHYTTKEENACI